MIKVENKNRHPNATEHYYYTIDNDGVEYLFTENHVSQAIERAQKNPEDIPNTIYENSNEFLYGLSLGFVVGVVFVCGFWLAKYTFG